MTEQELTDGLIIQNKASIQYLVDTYQQNVIKTAFYFVANMEDAEDLAQDVFIEVMRSIGRYQKKASIKTWIYRITVNKSLDHLRSQKRRNMFIKPESFIRISHDRANMFDGELAARDTGNDEKEKRRILEHAVNSLPENQKIAFILNKYDELSYKEIAGIMNLSLSSVESIIHRAKMNLQKILVNYFSEYANKKK